MKTKLAVLSLEVVATTLGSLWLIWRDIWKDVCKCKLERESYQGPYGGADGWDIFI